MLYYYETEFSDGHCRFKDDQTAIEYLTSLPSLVCIYKESDTEDGIPFIMVWEKGGKS